MNILQDNMHLHVDLDIHGDHVDYFMEVENFQQDTSIDIEVYDHMHDGEFEHDHEIGHKTIAFDQEEVIDGIWVTSGHINLDDDHDHFNLYEELNFDALYFDFIIKNGEELVTDAEFEVHFDGFNTTKAEVWNNGVLVDSYQPGFSSSGMSTTGIVMTSLLIGIPLIVAGTLYFIKRRKKNA